MRKPSLLAFFILSFAITWAMWIPAVGASGFVFAPDSPLGQLARWSPGITALILAGIAAGKKGIGDLLKPIKQWRIDLSWYLYVLAFQPVLFLLAKQIDRLLGNQYETPSALASVDAPLAFVIPIVIITALPGAFAEELGWRGFALPRLQNKYNALISSVIIGILWGAWHIPSLLYFGVKNPVEILLAVINAVPMAILYTWIYNNTRGSLVPVTILHASQQYSNNFLGTIPTYTDDILIWIVAIALTIVFGHSNLSKKDRPSSE